MPIVISRTSGDISAPAISPAQQEDLLAHILQFYIEEHPEIFNEAST